MRYRFTFYGILWSGSKGTWQCEKTDKQLQELVGTDEDLDDELFDQAARKLATDFAELIDYCVDSVETVITPIKLMSDENFEEAQGIEELED